MGQLFSIFVVFLLLMLNLAAGFVPGTAWRSALSTSTTAMWTSTEEPVVETNKATDGGKEGKITTTKGQDKVDRAIGEAAAGMQPREDTEWEGHQAGFEWEMEKARRIVAKAGSGFASFNMGLWEPRVVPVDEKPPGVLDSFKILFGNAMQMLKLADSVVSVCVCVYVCMYILRLMSPLIPI